MKLAQERDYTCKNTIAADTYDHYLRSINRFEFLSDNEISNIAAINKLLHKKYTEKQKLEMLNNSNKPVLPKLTEAQRTILAMLLEGKTDAKISQDLNLTTHIITNIKTKIFSQFASIVELKCPNKTAQLIYFLKSNDFAKDFSINPQSTACKPSPEIDNKNDLLSQTYHPSLSNTDYVKTLTKCELQVLKLLSSGWNYVDTAVKLNISENTVKTYTGAIFSKLGVTDRTQAAILGINAGILDKKENAQYACSINTNDLLYQKIARILNNEENAIKEIALKVGFACLNNTAGEIEELKQKANEISQKIAIINSIKEELSA